MSDAYDALLAQPSAATGAASADPYGDLLGISNQRQRLQSTLNIAVSTPPDQQAEQRNIARQLGTPQAAVAALPDDAKRAAAIQTIDANTANAPVLRRQYTDADFAKLAHDDSGVMSTLESAVGGLGRLGRYLVSADDDASLVKDVKAGYYSAESGAAGLFRAATETTAPLLDFLEADPERDRNTWRAAIGGNPLRRLAEGFSSIAERTSAVQKAVGSQTQGDGMGGVASGVQSLTQNLIMLPATLLSGGETAVLTAMSAITGGNSYEKAREAGVNPYSAALYGASDAVVEFATEKLPLHHLLGDVKKGLPFWQTLARNAALEIPGEQIATILQDANEWATLHPEKSLNDYLRERPSAALQTLIATVIGSGGQVTLMHSIQKAVDNANGRIQQVDEAEQFANALGQTLATAKDSKLRTRAPDVFAATIQQMADETGGAPSEVFADARLLAEALNQSGLTQEQLAKSMPNTLQSLREALVQNGTVAIPVGELIATAPGTQLEKSLTPILRQSAEGLSQVEAKEAGQQAQQFVEEQTQNVINQAQQRQEHDRQTAEIRQVINDQLAAAKRFRPAVNEAYSTMVGSFYSTMAQRLGVNPSELYARFPLKVSGELQAEQALKQGEKFTLDDLSLDQLLNPQTQSGAANNASGESAASLEAQSRLSQERAAGQTRLRFDRYGNATPLNTVDAVDQKAGPGEVIVQRGVGSKEWTVLDAGEGATRAAIARATGEFKQGESADIDEATGLPLNADGTVTVFHHTNAANAEKIRKSGLLKSAGEPDVYVTTRQDTDTGYGDVAVPVRVDPSILQLDDEFPNGRKDFRIDTGKPGGSIKVGVGLLEQGGARATFSPSKLLIALGKDADFSSFLHESGHFWLETLDNVANQEGAPEQIRQDWQTVLDWFGLTQEQWAGMSMDEKRPYHERFAESAEQYFFEAKSPSVELRGVFDRFRAWLTRVYSSLTQFVAGRENNDVALSDEVRMVMDRLLATDEQIQQAEAVRQYGLLFKSPEEAGMTPEQWAAYTSEDAKAHAQALAELGKKSMHNMGVVVRKRMRALKQIQADMAEKRKTVQSEAADAVAKEPVYQAMRWLRKGEMTNPNGEEIKAEKGFKLDRSAVETIFPESMPGRPDLAKLKGMVIKEGGLDPALVADMFGFRDGAHLITSILDAPVQQGQVDILTDRMMLERYGDAATLQGQERAADEAVHNEARARVLATEMAAVRQANNPRMEGANGKTVNAMVAAAQQFAERLVEDKKIKDLNPQVHTAAETRAARAAEKALAKGDTEGTIVAKRDQLLNFHAAKATAEAQTEAQKIQTFFRKIASAKDDTVGKTRDLDVVKAAQAILAAYGMTTEAKGKAAVDYLAVLEANDPAMFAAVRPGIDAALSVAKPIGELTMGELRALNDELESLWYLAKRSRQMEVGGDLMDIQDAADRLKSRMVELGIPEHVPGEASAITPAEQRALKLKQYLAAARRVESWAQAKDGVGRGAFRELVWEPVREAADRYRKEKGETLKAFKELLAPIEKTLVKRKIASQELNYTFGQDTDGVAMAEIMHAILHTGNESNKRKLLLGREWATQNPDGTLDTSKWDAFVSRMVRDGVLTKEHFDVAQSVWDLLEKTKPLAQKAHRDAFGRYFDEVAADKFVDPFGIERRGGYIPAQADARIVRDQATKRLMEDENASLQYAFPTTSKGFTKSRVEYNRPLLLDLRSLTQHIDKVLLFSHLENPVRDVRKLIGNKEVAPNLNKIDPAAIDSVLTPWLNRAAKQQVETARPGDWQSWKFWSALRRRAGMAAMFANVANAVQQFAGFSLAAVRVSPAKMASAMAQYVAAPKDMTEQVATKSDYMANRMSDEVQRMHGAINDILIDPTVYQSTKAFMERHAYFLQQGIDNVMGPIIWTAAYNHALEQGQEDRDAVRYADSTIRETQGSTAPEDMSQLESGSPFARLFTQFTGYFNMQANLLGTEFQVIARDLGLRKGLGRGLYVMMFGFLLNAWVAEAIMQAFKGGPDDDDKDGDYLDDWLAQIFGWSLVRNVTAMVPIAGQAANSLVNTFNSKPYDDRINASPAISMIESAVKVPQDVYKVATDKDIKPSSVIRDIGTLITMLTGLPANAFAKPVGYVADVQEGKVNPTSPADAVRGTITGTASPPSKH